MTKNNKTEIKGKHRIMAGIVLFNPNKERLTQNIDAIYPQVDKIVLIDNCSTNGIHIETRKKIDITLIRNNTNKGIAFALNQIMEYAFGHNFDWVITLDQDSVVSNNLINTYIPLADINKVGIISCKTKDRNFKEIDQDEIKPDRVVKYCITSAALTNVKAWKEVNGFDNQMFIDWVDWDICIALRHKGYKIIRTDRTYILHELGTKTRIKHLWKWSFLILNRSATRYYYVSRNWIYLGRKWKDENLFIKIIQVVKMAIIVMIYEGNKIKNAKAFFNGFIDGFKMHLKPQYDE